MKKINKYQCCYCKNSGNNEKDFDNVQPSSVVVQDKVKIQNHITHGCGACKSYAEANSTK